VVGGARENSHLDEAFGGFCVWAEVADDASFAAVDAIAKAVPEGREPRINTVRLSD
jgi:hypothetical protein